MSSDRNGRAFSSEDVLRRQQGYTWFGRGSLEAHMKGSIWLRSSDSSNEAPRQTEGLYPHEGGCETTEEAIKRKN